MPKLETKPLSWFKPDPCQSRKSLPEADGCRLGEALERGQLKPILAQPDGTIIARECGPPRRSRSEKVRVAVKEAFVLWLLLYHADLSDEQIARIAGCHPKSLYRMPFFKRMRRLLRECGAVLLPRNSSENGFDPVRRD